jgi:ribose transport system substrate-binding protein
MIICKDTATFKRGVCAAAAMALFSLGGVVASKAADPSSEEQTKTLAAVPTDAQKYYGGYWYAGNVVADPFAEWKPHPPPWQICHNDSYLGNSWRANLVAKLKALTKQLADHGLAKPDLIVTNSNGDINLELSQLKAQVAQGCGIIMTYPGSATGLCSGIKDAYNKGVLFVAIDSPVTCPEGLNVATNPYHRGQFGGEWIAKKLNGKGNVIVMNGQPGTANTVAQETGLRQTVASDQASAVSLACGLAPLRSPRC